MRGWTVEMRRTHINLRELWVAREWLIRHNEIRKMGVRFDMDNFAAVQCLQRQGTAHSGALLT